MTLHLGAGSPGGAGMLLRWPPGEHLPGWGCQAET